MARVHTANKGITNKIISCTNVWIMDKYVHNTFKNMKKYNRNKTSIVKNWLWKTIVSDKKKLEFNYNNN